MMKSNSEDRYRALRDELVDSLFWEATVAERVSGNDYWGPSGAYVVDWLGEICDRLEAERESERVDGLEAYQREWGSQVAYLGLNYQALTVFDDRTETAIIERVDGSQVIVRVGANRIVHQSAAIDLRDIVEVYEDAVENYAKLSSAKIVAVRVWEISDPPVLDMLATAAGIAGRGARG